jgi:hypothetical protein
MNKTNASKFPSMRIDVKVVTKSLAKGPKIPLSKTLYAIKTPERKTHKIAVVNNSAVGPKAKRTTSMYEVEPVLRTQQHTMYKLKSVMIAATTIIAVPKTSPALANTSGNESTPPPTTVATRLNVPEIKLVFRKGESAGGFISSRD